MLPQQQICRRFWEIVGRLKRNVYFAVSLGDFMRLYINVLVNVVNIGPEKSMWLSWREGSHWGNFSPTRLWPIVTCKASDINWPHPSHDWLVDWLADWLPVEQMPHALIIFNITKPSHLCHLNILSYNWPSTNFFNTHTYIGVFQLYAWLSIHDKINLDSLF